MVAVDSSPVFIARAAEIELLDAALARAAAGRPSVVVVGGEAGIGKTRLLEEFQARVRDRAVVVIGRCFPDSGDDSPYGPFADLFRDLVSQTPPDRLATILGPARTELGLVVPELGTAVDRVNPEDGVEVRTASRERLFELLLGIARRLQETRPAVIAIEDLQWADEATLGPSRAPSRRPTARRWWRCLRSARCPSMSSGSARGPRRGVARVVGSPAS